MTNQWLPAAGVANNLLWPLSSLPMAAAVPVAAATRTLAGESADCGFPIRPIRIARRRGAPPPARARARSAAVRDCRPSTAAPPVPSFIP